MLPAGEESVAVPKSSIMPISVHSWKLDNVYRDIAQSTAQEYIIIKGQVNHILAAKV
jgi:hypothetical protein